MNQDLSVASSNIIGERDFIDYEEDIVEELDSILKMNIPNDSISLDCSIMLLDYVRADGVDGGDDDECGQEFTTQTGMLCLIY